MALTNHIGMMRKRQSEREDNTNRKREKYRLGVRHVEAIVDWYPAITIGNGVKKWQTFSPTQSLVPYKKLG